MTTKEMLEKALQLDPAQRFKLVEDILRSLDEPDPVVDAAWADEAERRLAAYRAGKVKPADSEEVFGAL
jgi:putative addiction module component (TIGR02574 family)